ncbi:MAG: MFS transporter [Solirubrobacteraceae bacterium]
MEASSAVAVGARSAWAPMAHRTYRALWIAQFTSNVGTWMQTVGAQWLMGSLSRDPLKVALVQTAMSLPIGLFAMPAGAVGDNLDRRRVLLASQSFMLASAALLGALTVAGETTAWLLLGLTFAIGTGQALTAPSWQAIQPELVSRDEIPQAATLGGVNMNVARAVGPAIGGALVAAAGPGWVFLLNAASFVAVLAVLARWRRPETERPLGAEQLTEAMRAGVRYVGGSPRFRAVLVRTTVFAVFASALWALLPVVARNHLGMGSGGYGLLLGAIGAGALLGAVILPGFRARVSVNAIVAVASLLFALACAVLAWVRIVPIVVVALVGAGLAWIAVLGSLNGVAQTVLPHWVRSRGMALYLLTFQGGQAVGAFIWGVVARQAGTPTALAAVGAGLAAGLALVRRFALRSTEGLDVTPSDHWPEPHVVVDPDPGLGPVLVAIEYRVPLENAEPFREAMRAVGRIRRRTGGQRWSLYQDAADPERFVETYLTPTWQEHLRQHRERVTVTDRTIQERAHAFLAPGTRPRARHLLFAYGDEPLRILEPPPADEEAAER